MYRAGLSEMQGGGGVRCGGVAGDEEVTGAPGLGTRSHAAANGPAGKPAAGRARTDQVRFPLLPVPLLLPVPKRYLFRWCCLFPMLSHPPFVACSSAAARFLLCYCLFLLCCSCLILLVWPVPLLLLSPASSCALGFYWWAKFVVIFLIFPFAMILSSLAGCLGDES